VVTSPAKGPPPDVTLSGTSPIFAVRVAPSFVQLTSSPLSLIDFAPSFELVPLSSSCSWPSRSKA